ncbi:transmembrane 220 family protein [Snuella sedimenti]|uniref:Transmembrane 220 family protein n=1 Tax=Snuella sedimenti TaxID=2798802 RepID=A0A8J7LLS2_9FLAO|nr:transmembrane 220 family protein [Snuella sedimenti]MBJ6366654.1 transmembrane 220 family protein [Snuella sedimenti]
MNRSKKIINIGLFVLFGIFAFLQLNDPDAWVWFAVYGFVSAICLYSSFKVIPKNILIAIIIGLLAYSVFHFSLFVTYLQTEHKEEIFGKMVYEKPYLEGSREFLGLLIAALGVFYVLRQKKK